MSYTHTHTHTHTHAHTHAHTHTKWNIFTGTILKTISLQEMFLMQFIL